VAARKAQTEFRFRATLIEWRGPAPFVFAPVPDAQLEALRDAAKLATYGWGCVPVEATVSSVKFTTSLFPKGDTYLLPLKVAVRRKLNITVGDTISVVMSVQSKRL